MKSYAELLKDQEELQNAFDNESNFVTQKDIQANIDEVKVEIENYNLSDDDLFECTKCHVVSDIEDSVSESRGVLICENCLRS
jgi:hypothetical protein